MKHFIEMPGIADRSGSTPKPLRVGEADGLGPVADPFVRHGDAAFGEEVFGVAELKRSGSRADRVADDGGREPVARIADGSLRHPGTVPSRASS
jgi:hypothetical protein